jgi:hypothetical protein
MLLLTNTAARIPVGPLLAESNAKDPQTGLTVTALSVQMYRVSTSGGAVVRTQFAPTASGGDNDMILVPSSTDGMYDLELTAGDLNWLGNGRITVMNTAAILVWLMDFQLVSAQYFEFMFGSTPPAVALTTASREACADSLILRNQAGGSNSGRRFGEALYALRNRNEVVGGTQTVYQENDTTIAWTAPVSTDVGALPITGTNPSG